MKNFGKKEKKKKKLNKKTKIEKFKLILFKIN